MGSVLGNKQELKDKTNKINKKLKGKKSELSLSKNRLHVMLKI